MGHNTERVWCVQFDYVSFFLQSYLIYYSDDDDEIVFNKPGKFKSDTQSKLKKVVRKAKKKGNSEALEKAQAVKKQLDDLYKMDYEDIVTTCLLSLPYFLCFLFSFLVTTLP
jgi:hypothetical protein